MTAAYTIKLWVCCVVATAVCLTAAAAYGIGGLLGSGFALGVAQWVVVRGAFARRWSPVGWVVVTGVGWALGWGIGATFGLGLGPLGLAGGFLLVGGLGGTLLGWWQTLNGDGPLAEEPRRDRWVVLNALGGAAYGSLALALLGPIRFGMDNAKLEPSELVFTVALPNALYAAISATGVVALAREHERARRTASRRAGKRSS